MTSISSLYKSRLKPTEEIKNDISIENSICGESLGV
jgi:hypothetical protein